MIPRTGDSKLSARIPDGNSPYCIKRQTGRKSLTKNEKYATFLWTNLKPQSPYPVDAGVCDGRCSHAPVLAPSPAVENPRNRSQQDVAPIEMRRSFVEVRKPEKCRGDHQSRAPSYPAF